MILHKNSLPIDFYDQDGFPREQYVFHKGDTQYSIGSYCETPIGKGEIVGIMENGIEILTLDERSDKIHISFIKLLGGLVNEKGYDKKGFNLITEEQTKIEKIKQEENLNRLIKNTNYTFIENSFQKDHNNNYLYILDKIKKIKVDIDFEQERFDEIKSMDYKDKLDLIGSGYIFPEQPKYDEYTNHINAKKDAYFYYLNDIDGHTYISSHINAKIADKKIIKYTNARRGYLKQNQDLGKDRTSIKVYEDKVIYHKKININETVGITINKELLNQKPEVIQNKDELIGPKGMGDISNLMIADQDKVMRATPSGNVLITGVAGSGKTNVLLHRIDYLISEYSNDFNQEGFGFFCFNISLKKYVENMIHQKFERVKVFSIDDFFQNECKRLFGAKYSFNRDNEKNITNNIVKLIESNIGDYLKIDYIKKEKTKKERSFIDLVLGRGTKEKQEITYNISLDFQKISQSLNQNISSINKETFLAYYYALSCLKISVSKQNPYEIEAQKIIFNDKNSNITKEFSLSQIMHLFPEKKIAIKHFNIGKPTFNYILVDEVQDLQPIEIKILSNLSIKGMTLAGDISQLLFQQNVTDLGTYFGIQFNEKYELRMSHRGSLQTIFFANQILEGTNGVKADKVNFLGEKPEIIISNNSSEISKIILELIIKCSEKGSVCVACSPKNSGADDNAEKVSNWLTGKGIDTYYARKDSRDFSKKVHITNYMQIKGLEFDYVIVLNANNYLSNEYDPGYRKNKRQVIYTVFTRAKQKLIIIDKGIGFFESFDPDSYTRMLL